MSAVTDTLLQTARAQLALLEPQPTDSRRVGFGLPEIDEVLCGGLVAGAVHEIFEAAVDAGAAASGFVVALAQLAAGLNRKTVWIRQRLAVLEAGRLLPSGLAELGADPASFIMVTVKDALAVLKAAAEAVRCSAIGAVIVEPWGTPKVLDHTAVRRLSLTAAQSGVPTFLLRRAAAPAPNAAFTRWSVRATPSEPLPAGAPGPPAFEATLLRHRAGIAGQTFYMEWDRDQRSFRGRPPLSRIVPAVAADRSDPAVRPSAKLRLAS